VTEDRLALEGQPWAPDFRHGVRMAVHLEIVTVVWMLAEATLAIGAGIAARSVALTAFGLDSVIELLTGGTLLWRLVVELRAADLHRVDRAERRAAWLAAVALLVLCLYVAGTSALSLATRTHPEASLLGIGVAGVALIGMPVLAVRKRHLATLIGSAALRGDAACSVTCAYLAGTTLVGLALNALLGWWWADSAAALVLLYWLGREAREAWHGAREGRHDACCGRLA